MTSSNLMSEGFMLMIFGMGSVFVFLTLLVIFTILMSWLTEKYDAKYNLHETVSSAPSLPSKTIDQSTLLAILTSAVHQYRSKNK